MAPQDTPMSMRRLDSETSCGTPPSRDGGSPHRGEHGTPMGVYRQENSFHSSMASPRRIGSHNSPSGVYRQDSSFYSSNASPARRGPESPSRRTGSYDDRNSFAGSPRSPHSCTSTMASPSSRSRRPLTLEEQGIVLLDGMGHKEKLPRPSAGILSMRGAYGRSAGEEMKKSALPKFLCVSTQAVLMRPRRVAASLPVPLAAISCPFADGYEELALPLADPGPEGPLRCPRCRSYSNPYFRWSSREADRLICNMCDQHIQASETLLDDLDRSGKCTEGREHPELAVGSVDMPAPQAYDVDRPAGIGPPVLLIALELTQQSVQSGLFQSMLHTLLDICDLEDPLISRRVCLVTFGDAVEFYSPTRSGRFRVVAMQSINDPFVPLSVEALFLDTSVEASLCQLRSLLEQLLGLVDEPSKIVQEVGNSPAGGAALRAAVDAVMQAGGGDVWMCHAGTPSSGLGAMRSSPESTAKGPQQASFHEEMLSLCVRGGVAISTVLAPAAGAAIDSATMQWLPSCTGGDALLIDKFNPAQHATKLTNELRHWVRRMMASAYSCVFKLRCSKGLEVASRLSPWPVPASGEEQDAFELPRMSPDMSLAFKLKLELDPDDDSPTTRRDDRKALFLQTVILHTNAEGHRLLRVHTVPITVVSSIGSVFRNTNLVPLVAFLVKTAASTLQKQRAGLKVTPVKDMMLSYCSDLLAAFRSHCCSAHSNQTGLLVPRDLALLPLYTLAIRKLVYAITCDGALSYSLDIPRMLLTMPMHCILPLLYPRICPVETADCDTGGTSTISNLCPCLQEYVTGGPSAAYLIVNGVSAWLCIADKERFADEADLASLWRAAEILCCSLQDALQPNPSPMSLCPAPLALDDGSMPWPEKAALGTIFTEDDGAGEMSYAHWVHHIQRKVLRDVDSESLRT